MCAVPSLSCCEDHIMRFQAVITSLSLSAYKTSTSFLPPLCLLPLKALRAAAISPHLKPQDHSASPEGPEFSCWLSPSTCQHGGIMQVPVCNFRSVGSQLNSSGLYIPMCVTQPCVDSALSHVSKGELLCRHSSATSTSVQFYIYFTGHLYLNNLPE